MKTSLAKSKWLSPKGVGATIVSRIAAISLLFAVVGCENPNQTVTPSSPVPIASTAPVPVIANVSMRLPIPVVDTAFSPYYLAVDKGIFAKYGLNVKLEPGTPELNPVKMLAQGTDQFAVLGGPEILFSARSKGAQIVGTALLHKDANFVTLLTKL